jgi:hypothetical protein
VVLDSQGPAADHRLSSDRRNKIGVHAVLYTQCSGVSRWRIDAATRQVERSNVDPSAAGNFKS